MTAPTTAPAGITIIRSRTISVPDQKSVLTPAIVLLAAAVKSESLRLFNVVKDLVKTIAPITIVTPTAISPTTIIAGPVAEPRRFLRLLKSIISGIIRPYTANRAYINHIIYNDSVKIIHIS